MEVMIAGALSHRGRLIYSLLNMKGATHYSIQGQSPPIEYVLTAPKRYEPIAFDTLPYVDYNEIAIYKKKIISHERQLKRKSKRKAQSKSRKANR